MQISKVSAISYRGNPQALQPQEESKDSQANIYAKTVGTNVMKSVAVFGGLNLLTQLLIKNTKGDGLWSFWTSHKAIDEIRNKGFSKAFLKQDLFWGAATGIAIGTFDYFSRRKKQKSE